MPHKARIAAKQRTIFLESEGNAWLERNQAALNSRELPDSDPILTEILRFPPSLAQPPRVLEIGCGDGTRLSWLQKNLGFVCSGIDPSSQAVELAVERGIAAQQGTADNLPFADEEFEIVIFGFCLYLCDREDLFRIACEADRVLNSPGWMIIHDFYSATPLKREYKHRRGMFSYKMDYRTLFTWNPAYTCYSHRLRHHSENNYTDDRHEWVATSVLRKHLENDE